VRERDKKEAESPEGDPTANASRPPATVRNGKPSGNAPGTHDHATDHEVPPATEGATGGRAPGGPTEGGVRRTYNPAT
jgi:hypothetical protein